MSIRMSARPAFKRWTGKVSCLFKKTTVTLQCYFDGERRKQTFVKQRRRRCWGSRDCGDKEIVWKSEVLWTETSRRTLAHRLYRTWAKETSWVLICRVWVSLWNGIWGLKQEPYLKVSYSHPYLLIHAHFHPALSNSLVAFFLFSAFPLQVICFLITLLSRLKISFCFFLSSSDSFFLHLCWILFTT